MIFRSKAPLRISFGGGGTDVSPYKDERGGAVLSATIDKYAYGTLRTNEEKKIRVQSLDFDMVAKYHLDEKFSYNGELDLVKAVINELDKERRHGLDFFIHSDAPPGSGLGSSSTMVVALIGLMQRFLKLPMTNYDVAELAYQVERVELGIRGGMQDQYAAVFGGFNFIEFKSDTVIVNPLRIDTETINELEYHLLLCYTGRTRLSGNIINTQVDNYIHGKVDAVKAMDELKGIAVELKNALLQNRLDDFGRLLHEGWVQKKKMAKQITNPQIDKLYEVARKNGAIGGKILGAGGGGYLLLYCKFNKKHDVSRKLEELGGQLVKFTFERNGLQTWRANNG